MERLDRYQTIAELGSGGMADVYLALSQGPQGFEKLVVIKKIRFGLAQNDEFLRMFADEARIAARLNHPHIVQTLGYGYHGSRYAIVMEYLEGQSLYCIEKRLQNQGLRWLDGLLALLIQVLSGLHYAHQLRDYDGTALELVHRDVSPHNVFVTYDGQAKLLDFGIAKALGSFSHTEPGVVKGKLAYMSPEQERGQEVDACSDVFAVGVMLWEALTGQSLWSGLSDVAIVSRLRFGEIPSPRTVNPEVSQGLEAVCMKALAHRKAHRYQSAAEFKTALEAQLEARSRLLSTDQLGEYVAKLFAPERAQMGSLLALRLGELRAHGVHPSDTPPPSSLTPMPVPVLAPTEVMSHGGHHEDSSPRYLHGTEAKAQSQPPGALPDRSRLKPLLALGLGLGLVVVSSMARPWRHGASSWEAALSSGAQLTALTASPLPAATPSASIRPEPASVELRVTVYPKQATVWLDEQKLQSNPFVGRFALDSHSHRLRIEAPGFRTQERALALDHNWDINVSLMPLAPKILPLPSPQSPASAVPSASSPSPSAIQFEDPWAP